MAHNGLLITYYIISSQNPDSTHCVLSAYLLLAVYIITKAFKICRQSVPWIGKNIICTVYPSCIVWISIICIWLIISRRCIIGQNVKVASVVVWCPCWWGPAAEAGISFKNTDNSWTEPVNMGPDINSTTEDVAPYVSPDGNYLFFFTSRQGDNDYNPYWVSTQIIEDLKPAELK